MGKTLRMVFSSRRVALFLVEYVNDGIRCGDISVNVEKSNF